MAAEEKPFDPTPARIAKARKEGNIARSAEITAVASFGLGVLALLALAPQIGAASRIFIARSAMGDYHGVSSTAYALAAIVAGIYLACATGGVVASLLQSKGLAFVAPKFKLDRLKPTEGFKRMFSMQSVISAVKALLAFAFAIAIAIPIVQLVFVRGTGAAEIGPLAFIAIIGAQRALFGALAIAVVFAVVDYLVVRKQWIKKLRMSLYEIKKEYAESEGDPQLRGKRKQRHRALISGPISNVKNASFVVANPTHVAVALQYAPPEIGVPMVLVMGVEENALRMRELASEAGIPIVENVELARALWASATVGKPIPRESFVAVAEIVTALFTPAGRL